jgi:hypothetical protein
MFAHLLAPLRAKLNLAVMSVACYTAAGIAAAVALAFGIAALFRWLDDQYGAIVACLIVAAGFLVLAIIPMIVLALARKAEQRRLMVAAAKARQTQWISPATLTLGLQAMRMLGRNRGVAMAAVGSVLAGWLISQLMGEEDTEDDEAAEPAE